MKKLAVPVTLLLSMVMTGCNSGQEFGAVSASNVANPSGENPESFGPLDPPNDPIDPTGGAEGEGEGENTNTQEITDTFTQAAPTAQKVDILFVIDNSGSMREEQMMVMENLHLFMQSFTNQLITPDFRVMITTTDPRANAPGGDGRLVEFNPGVFHLDRSTFERNETQFYQQFARGINRGTNGSGTEVSLWAAFRSLTRHGNEFRKIAGDADTHIVLISDEKDSSKLISGQERFEILRRIIADAGRVKVHSIVNFVNRGTFQTKGEDQLWASDVTGGKKIDIFNPFGAELATIGEAIYHALFSFQLTRRPVNSEQIVVKVNDSVVNNWVYQSAGNSIEFSPEDAPIAGSQISVEYRTITTATAP